MKIYLSKRYVSRWKQKKFLLKKKNKKIIEKLVTNILNDFVTIIKEYRIFLNFDLASRNFYIFTEVKILNLTESKSCKSILINANLKYFLSYKNR